MREEKKSVISTISKALCVFALLLGLSGCVASKKESLKLVGLGHTFRDLRQHTFSESSESEFSFCDISPDGKRMAVVYNRSGNKDIFIKDINSRAMTQKTFHQSDDSFPAFSPDGSKIAFATQRNGNWDVFIMNADRGKAKRQITSSPDIEIAPTWSPDGTTLAFCRLSTASGEWEIWTYNIESGALSSLVPGKFPHYSPIRDSIVFQRALNNSNSENWFALWSIDSEGYQETVIASSEEEGYITPSWSKDGRKIVFSSGGKSQKAKLISESSRKEYDVTLDRKAGDIWIINSDGTNIIQLTAHEAEDFAPVFSTDGRVYFVSKRDKFSNIWSVVPEYVE